jgi:nitrate reductase gamma subunit
MPWAMESTRRNFVLYAQFVIFHMGVVAAIALSFIIPYFPEILNPTMVVIIQVLTGAACLVGILRIIRRIGSVYIRALSSPDDHFSLWLLTVWFAFATLAAPNNYAAGEIVLIIYFYLTAFFLLYVPFSKISHYLYYPFTRYYLGKTMGRRGVYPMTKAPQQ